MIAPHWEQSLISFESPDTRKPDIYMYLCPYNFDFQTQDRFRTFYPPQKMSGVDGSVVLGHVQQLAKHMLAAVDGHGNLKGSEARHSRISSEDQRGARIAMRILGSTISAPLSASDESSSLLIARKQILVAEKSNNVPLPASTGKSMRFAELHHRLQALDALQPRHRVALLHVLVRLGEMRLPSFTVPSGLISSMGEWEESPAQTLTEEPHRRGPNSTLAANGHTTGTKGVEGGGGVEVPCSVQQDGNHMQSDDEVAMEQAILKDILFVLQGIDGKYVKFCEATFRHVVDPSVLPLLPPGSGDLIAHVCEMSWLYSRIEAYVHCTDEMNDPRDVRPGLVRQAFAYSVGEEHTEYYRFLAVLDSQLGVPEAGLTLRRLAVWALEPIERLRLIATLVDAAGSLQGGALASCLHTHMQQGDPVSRAFVEHILRRVCAPIFTMISDWVFEGSLSDPNREFFVGAVLDVPPDRLWQDKYFINANILPKFIPPEMSNKILVVGKSINFLRQCCKAKGAVSVSSIDLAQGDAGGRLVSAAAEALTRVNLEYGAADALYEAVERAYTVINARIREILMNNHKLLAHLLALKKFLLLGQGDFVTSLMDCLGHELGKRASQIFRHNLNGIVEGALRSSMVQYEDAELLDRVAVRLLEPSAGDTGWEVFSLDYIVDGPLTAVIHSNAGLKYRRIFHLLWRIKRAEWALNKAWSDHMSVIHQGVAESIPELRSAFHRCAIFRAQMVFFSTNLSNYMMFEVLEMSWHELCERLNNAPDLDEIICAHDDYLNIVLERALMGPRSEDIMAQLVTLLDLIIQFCAHQEVLIVKSLSEMMSRKEEAYEVMKSASAGRWGTEFGIKRREEAFKEEAAGGDRFDFVALSSIEHVSKEYAIAFRRLVDMLEQQSETSEILRYLCFRLDFNEVRGKCRRYEMNLVLVCYQQLT